MFPPQSVRVEGITQKFKCCHPTYTITLFENHHRYCDPRLKYFADSIILLTSVYVKLLAATFSMEDNLTTNMCNLFFKILTKFFPSKSEANSGLADQESVECSIHYKYKFDHMVRPVLY